MMLDKDIEEDPADNTDRILKDQRCRLNQYEPAVFEIEPQMTIKLQLPVNALRIDDAKYDHHTRRFRQYR